MIRNCAEGRWCEFVCLLKEREMKQRENEMTETKITKHGRI